MMDAAQLKSWLAKKDETLRIEFKLKYLLGGPGNNKHKDELAKDLLALANTSGRRPNDDAHLIIGAGDKLKPDGTRDKDDVRPYAYSRTSFLDTVNARCHPPLPDLNYAELELEGNYYGIIEVTPSPFMHELSRDLDATSGSWRKGLVPIRRGDGIAPATFQEMELLKKEKANWGVGASALEELEEYLNDPVKKLKVRSLITNEATKLCGALNEAHFLEKDSDKKYAAIIERMNVYEALLGPFLELFAAGCYFGEDWLQAVWPEALSIVANSTSESRGVQALLHLRRYPALLILYVGGVAAVAGSRYGNLVGLLRHTKIKNHSLNNSVSSALAPGRIVSPYDEKHLAENKNHKMPFNFHLVNVLREALQRYIHSNDEYMENFVRFEYLYALVSESQGNGLIVGSYAWESEQMRRALKFPGSGVWIVRETDEELDRLGSDWPPLKSGLFDGPIEEFRSFKTAVDEKVSKAALDFFRK